MYNLADANSHKRRHMEDLSHLRLSYEKSQLLDLGLPDDPNSLFAGWFRELKDLGKETEINAMTLSTIGTDGFPKARVVLLKSFGPDGLVFFTNYESEKGRAIAENPHVCISFFWPSMERQVIIKGIAGKVPDAESDDYFHSRPKGSRLGAAASRQSQTVGSRQELDDRLRELEKQYTDADIPKPGYWGGYRVLPQSFEFWQGRANRLHDRILYEKISGLWSRNRLQP